MPAPRERPPQAITLSLPWVATLVQKDLGGDGWEDPSSSRGGGGWFGGGDGDDDGDDGDDGEGGGGLWDALSGFIRDDV